jgi:hypothetical protein
MLAGSRQAGTAQRRRDGGQVEEASSNDETRSAAASPGVTHRWNTTPHEHAGSVTSAAVGVRRRGIELPM